MASIAFDSITRKGSQSWRYAWTGTGPYRVMVAGRVYSDNWPDAYIDVGGYSTAEPYEVEVCEYADALESDTYPAYATLQWFGNPDATCYAVYNGTTLLGYVNETGAGYYSWTSALLTDLTTYNFDVKQVDSDWNEGTSTRFTVNVVRNPTPPLTAITYDDDTLTFTVSAA